MASCASPFEQNMAAVSKAVITVSLSADEGRGMSMLDCNMEPPITLSRTFW